MEVVGVQHLGRCGFVIVGVAITIQPCRAFTSPGELPVLRPSGKSTQHFYLTRIGSNAWRKSIGLSLFGTHHVRQLVHALASQGQRALTREGGRTLTRSSLHVLTRKGRRALTREGGHALTRKGKAKTTTPFLPYCLRCIAADSGHAIRNRRAGIDRWTTAAMYTERDTH